jgi:hypothetical protein
VLAYYHAMIGNHAVGLADIEWDPPVFPALSFFQFAIPLVLAGCATVAVLTRGRRPSGVLVVGVALSAGAASIAMRNSIWLSLAAAALIAQTAPAWLPTSEARPAFLRVLAFSGGLLAVLGLGRLATRTDGGFTHRAPLEAIAATATYAAAHPCARVLGDNDSASALLWLEPSMAGRVGFDGELEAYPQPALTSWVAFQAASGSDWLAAAHGYGLLIGASAQPVLVRQLGSLAGGTVLARDSRGIAVADVALGSPACAGVANVA